MVANSVEFMRGGFRSSSACDVQVVALKIATVASNLTRVRRTPACKIALRKFGEYEPKD